MTGYPPTRGGYRTRPPSGASSPSCLIVLLFGVALIGALAFTALQVKPDSLDRVVENFIVSLDEPAAAAGSPVLFTVRRGESAEEIGRRLAQTGLIRDANVFRLIMTYHGGGDELQAGDYNLSPTMTTGEIINRIRAGQVATIQLTVPEGWRTAEIVRMIQERNIWPNGEVLAAIAPGAVTGELVRQRPTDAALEGYLFPDTYTLSPRSSAQALVQQMAANLDQKFTPAMRRQAAAANLTVHEVLTLASIVEREAAQEVERPLIASVFHNRLKQNMRLDADPTVQYALAATQTVAGPEIWRELKPDDLDVESPYNTYRRTGLPPGPICNPGIASIRAVLEPAQSEFLYFVARGDGSHVFARTLEEHTENIRRYSQ